MILYHTKNNVKTKKKKLEQILSKDGTATRQLNFFIMLSVKELQTPTPNGCAKASSFKDTTENQ